MRKIANKSKTTVRSSAVNPEFVEIYRRLNELEARPSVMQLDPDVTYCIIVPEAIPGDDFTALSNAIAKYPNIFLIAADTVRFLEVR